jgi:transcriptional regulator with XRE-family HTH domain
MVPLLLTDCVGVPIMATAVKQYRLDADLSLAELARRAGVDFQTVKRAETGQPIQEINANKIARALSQALNTTLTINDLGIRLYS